MRIYGTKNELFVIYKALQKYQLPKRMRDCTDCGWMDPTYPGEPPYTCGKCFMNMYDIEWYDTDEEGWIASKTNEEGKKVYYEKKAKKIKPNDFL